jgi:hypothetical protein
MRWLPKRWTKHRAGQFVLGFGKHRGLTIGELAEIPEGRQYLQWLCGTQTGNAAIAASIALGSTEPGEVVS